MPTPHSPAQPPLSTPTLLVGAGPIGLEVAIALKKEGLPYTHLDAGPIGSTMRWWAPGTRFFSSPERIALAGIPLTTRDQDKATREEYLAYLRQVAGGHQLIVRTGARVTSVTPGASPRFVARADTESGPLSIHAEHVILAIGDLHAPRLLNIPGEDLPFVSHYLREVHDYFGRRVVIVGGRNSAVEAAIRLYRVGAASVAIVHRGADFDPERIKYWLLPEIRHLIKNRAITFHPGTTAERITPGAVHCRAPDGTQISLPADDALLLTGYVQDASLFESAGVRLEGEGRAPAYNPRTMETSVRGLYVAGTAAAGTQAHFKLFIENCHNHGPRIAASIAGKPPPRSADDTRVVEAPES